MPTTNPVPSQDPSDLLFNAGKLDEVLNGTGTSFTDRLGTARRTVAGMNADFDAQLADAESDLNVYRADAAASAAQALGYLNTIRTTSYGAYASDPATDPLGNPPNVGDEYFNTTSNLLKRFNGTTWQASDINTANLAAPSGSSLVGYDSQTVQDVLDAVTGPTGAASVGYTPAGTGAVATTVDLKLNEFVSAKDFGAKNDSATDNSVALQTALASGKNFIKFPNNGGSYKFSSVSAITLQNDVVLDFEDAECDFTGSIQLIATSVTTVGTLDANVSRYATSVVLNASYPAESGDLLVITTTIAVDSAWSYKKKDCVRIKSISGATVELEEPLNFAYTTSDAGLNVSIYKKRKVTLLNTNFKLSSVSGQAMVDLQYLSDVVVSKHQAAGSPVFDPSTDITRRSIRFLSCFNVKTNFLHFENLSYPMLATGGSRNITADAITLIKCRHAFEPGDWAKTVKLSNITGSGCFSAISAHPSFDVWYENVNVSNEIGPSNLRSVGGGVINATVHTTADDSADGPYFHTVSLNVGYTSLYADADLTFDGFEIKSPNRTKPTLGASFGRQVTVNRTKGIGFATGGLNAIGRIVFGYGNRFSNAGDVMLPPKYRAAVNAVSGIRAPLSIATNPLLRAYEAGGRYHIDPSLYMVDQSSKYLCCYGQVVSGISGEPANIPLRIHTNAFSEYDSPGIIFGILKLKAKVRHSNSGVFAAQEKWFNFYHKTPATSSVEFPTTAVFTSGLSGQANESLALTISSISQAGVTEAGAGGDFYVDLQASLASGRTSPVYSLEYELELSIL